MNTNYDSHKLRLCTDQVKNGSYENPYISNNRLLQLAAFIVTALKFRVRVIESVGA